MPHVEEKGCLVDGIANKSLAHCRLFKLPKEGKTDEEYEDACAMDEEAGIYVVTDGASDSAFSRLWAHLLAQRFIEALPPESGAPAWRTWIAPAQDKWQATVRATPVPWYVESKIRQGAFATCVALILRAGSEGGTAGQWAGLAVGDSCLFHVQDSAAGAMAADSRAARGWPISDPQDFNLHPLALSSNPASNETVWPEVAIAAGTWHPGDSFILASDATAEWIMHEFVPDHAWERLLQLLDTEGDAAFGQLVADARAGGRLRNDDLTLLILRTQRPAAERE